MRLILNGINGQYLQTITENAAGKTDFVEAAVAYASNESLLFEWCWENKIPLRYWGRFDESVPINVGILKNFLSRRSPNYTCKLVRHFHPKVIWWHGVGAYIGSANFSDRAWYNNIEAGCFFDEPEMSAASLDVQLADFFRNVDERSSPLTEEVFLQIQARAHELDSFEQQDRDRAKRFASTKSVTEWRGLLREGQESALNRQKKAFLEEWYRTLQTIRDIAATVSADENRPSWVPKEVPAGAQADQFLHAHYQANVIDEERRSRFEEHYERNRRDPANALRVATAWWKTLRVAPTNEDRMLLDWAPFLHSRLSRENLRALDAKGFEEICQRVWSIRDHARRVSNATLSLPDGQRHNIDTKTHALADYLFTRRTTTGATVIDVIYHVLYGGRDEDVPTRLWDAISNGAWRIEHLGMSALGELIGWALPDKFPPRNNRTSKSLRSLGFSVNVEG